MIKPGMIGKINEIRWLYDGKYRFIKRYSLLISTLFTLSFCTGVLDGNGGKPGQSPSDNIKNNPNELIITAGATDITDWSARLSAFANPTVEMNPLEIGILYTSEKTITLENSVKLTSKELDSDHMFTVSAVGLSPKTQYYYKSYVLYADVYRYGKVRSFTTKDIEGVDLGLSVKWASRNMGEVNLVDSAEEYGGHFTWGEVNITKLGGKWRLPSKENFEELINNCKIERTKYNNEFGYRFTSKKPGYTDMWIFLPAAGHLSGGTNWGASYSGDYWSSSFTDNPSNAWFLYMDYWSRDNTIHISLSSESYDMKYSVRLVCDK